MKGQHCLFGGLPTRNSEDPTEPGRIVVGYRRPVPGPSQLTKQAFADVDALLDAIAKQATAE